MNHPVRSVLALVLMVFGTACGSRTGAGAPDASDGGDDGEDSAGIDASIGPVVDGGPAVCGDGTLTAPEGCDDGDLLDGDGCTSACAIEADFACPAPGLPCVRIVTCGNGHIEGDETCDDGNLVDDDGCDGACVRTDGWSCPLAGAACVATACGDGIVAGFEACDDGAQGAGCVDCALEPGYYCPVPGAPCQVTACGDSLAQGLEQCDDGNAVVGDGCTPGCVREPSCTDGVCEPVCGDSVVQPGETCDDGNAFRGDGCSETCQEEQGFACDENTLAPPDEVKVYSTVRDFIAACGAGSRLVEGADGAQAPYGHPDFECYNGAADGMVATLLDDDRKPVRVANSKTTSDAGFAQWYRSDDVVNRTIATELTLPSIGNGVYRLDSSSFYPATGLGFDVEMCGASPCEQVHADGNGSGNRNFHFTSEVHFWFDFNGTETLAFSGDDDVWVFINNRLAVDIGGVHGRLSDAVDLSDALVANNLGLTLGGTYQAIVFQAERHTTQSQYRLTLSNFARTPSTCTDVCGDGVVSSREVCDAGNGNGEGDGSAYGGCTLTCTLEPYCGDGAVDEGYGEVCDDGLNLGGNASACAPGCQSMGAMCGDGVLQPDNDESCDDGNVTSGDGCSAICQLEID